MSARRNNWFKRLFGDSASDSSSARPQGRSDDSFSTPTPPPSSSSPEPPEESTPTEAEVEPVPARASTPANVNSSPYLTVFDPSTLEDAEFYRRMRVTLQPLEIAEASGGTSDFGPHAPARPFSDDTLIRLTLDMPRDGAEPTLSQPQQAATKRDRKVSMHATFPLSEETMADRGPVEDLYRMGYRNLWQELIDSDLHVNEISPGPKEKVWAFEGTSPYIGSAPIFLEELIEKFLPQIDMDSGVLFTMPSTGQMLVRDVTAGMELFHTIGLLATASADEYFKSPDKISPRLHLWHEGQIETISDIKMPEPGEQQTEIQIKPTAYLMTQMNEGPDAPEDWMKGFGSPSDDPDDPDDPDDNGPDGPTPPPVA